MNRCLGRRRRRRRRTSVGLSVLDDGAGHPDASLNAENKDLVANSPRFMRLAVLRRGARREFGVEGLASLAARLAEVQVIDFFLRVGGWLLFVILLHLE